MPFYVKAQKLTGTFNVYHFNPPTLNNNTSTEVIGLFITALDNKGVILKEADVNSLKAGGSDLFNQVSAGNNAYADMAAQIYLEALNSTDSILTYLTTKTPDFKQNDTLSLQPYNSKKISYSKDLKFHAKRIERYVKGKSYESVTNTDNYASLSEAEFNIKAQEFFKTLTTGLQINIREEIKSYASFVDASLLNAIAQRYDPHSNYFTEEQNDEFNTQLSAQISTFGFYLEENEDGTIIIGDVEPGGSAWMSNDINEGDIFVSVKINNDKLIAEGSNAREIQAKIDKTKGDGLALTVKKQNGLFKTVKLVKQKAASTDNMVKGYVLAGNRSKTGYISLPSFYTDMEDHNLPGCANDVAKEILKLQNDSINGLILDLRNNGGGSMSEAMNLAGIFIDEGPIFIIKDKNKKPALVKDINRGSVFKKPIVVLINEASASASELFANIVKDYNLGVVVGQTSYGKGTAQSVLPLDTNLVNSTNKNVLKNNSDFIKITMSKFYRLNNSTHQGTGVVPDIVLPATPGYAAIKENMELFYLSADSISKKVMFTPNPKINLQALQENSAKRVARSKDFLKYKQLSDSVSLSLDKPVKVALKVNDFKKFKKENDALYKRMEKAFDMESTALTCMNNSFDVKLEQIDEETREFNAKILQSIQKDIFINESFNIMADLNSQQPK